MDTNKDMIYRNINGEWKLSRIEGDMHPEHQMSGTDERTFVPPYDVAFETLIALADGDDMLLTSPRLFDGRIVIPEPQDIAMYRPPRVAPSSTNSQHAQECHSASSRTSSSPNTVLASNGQNIQTSTPSSSVGAVEDQHHVPSKKSPPLLYSMEAIASSPLPAVYEPSHPFAAGHCKTILDERRGEIFGFEAALPDINENTRWEHHSDDEWYPVSYPVQYYMGPPLKPLSPGDPAGAEEEAVKQQHAMRRDQKALHARRQIEQAARAKAIRAEYAMNSCPWELR